MAAEDYEFDSPVNLNQNELRQAAIQTLASDPSSPVAGQVWFNSTSKRYRYYDGSTAQDIPYSGSIVNNDVKSDAAIALSKLATDPLARANHTGTQTASTISDFNTAVRTNKLNQMATPDGDVSLGSHKLTNVTDPTGAQDAATKAYVDTIAQGLDAKASVKAASTGNLTLSGTQTVDGVSLSPGDRVLVKDQTTKSQNGIYVVASGSWSRATDADAWSELVSAFTFVEQGTANKDTGWVCTVDAGGTLGTTDVAWTQFSSAGTITAGDGLTKTGNELDVVVGAGLKIDGDGKVAVQAGYGIFFVTDGAGGTMLSARIDGDTMTLKTIDEDSSVLAVADGGITGTQLATGAVSLAGSKVSGTLPVSKGGTGATTADGALTALGALKSVVIDEHDAGATWTLDSADHGLSAVTAVNVFKQADNTWRGTGLAIAGDEVTITVGASVAADFYRFELVGIPA